MKARGRLPSGVSAAVSLVVAFDESLRDRTYFGGAAVYEGASARLVDRLVRAHRMPGQRRFHTKDESSGRRLAFLKCCAEAGLVRVWIYTAPFPATAARQAIVCALTLDAVKNSVSRLVLERGDPERDRLDRQMIARTLAAADGDLSYSHDPPGAYTGMEIADAAVWAYGAGGNWTRTVGSLIEFVRQLDTQSAKPGPTVVRPGTGHASPSYCREQIPR